MSNLRLGVSNNILPFTQAEVLEADRKLNRFVINTVQGGLRGLGYGVLASWFFVNKRRVIFYAGGFGAGITFFTTICNEFNK